MAYHQNAHITTIKLAAHADVKILKIGQDFPGQNRPKSQK